MRSGLRLLWALDVRHLVAHRARLALSALGIGVGVALAVAVGALNTSISASLQAAAEATASEANLEIRPNGSTGLLPDVLADVAAVPGIEEAGATVESFVRLRTGDGEARVLLVGVDQGILNMAPTAIDPETIDVADPFGLFVPAEVAGELGVAAGEQVEVTTPDGWQTMPVGAVVGEEQTSRSRVVVGTVGALQPLLDRGTTYDAIYLKAADPEAALERVQEAVGGRGRVGPIAFRDEQIKQLLAGATASLNVGSIVALFVGAFLVYNTMAMAAVERVGEAALLRAVGAKRRQVFALFLAEGTLLGAVGSAVGVGGGALLAGGLLARQGGALEQIYPIQITRLDLSASMLALAAVAGLVASTAAAFLPARRVAGIDPAAALGPAGTFEDPTRGPRRLVTVAGVVGVVAGPAIAVPSVTAGVGTTGVTMLGFAVTLAGIALLIPVAVPAIARMALSRVERSRYARGTARLAVGEVLRSPGRTAFTVGAVLLALALVVGFSVGQSSFANAFEAEFEDIISADLYVRSATWRPFGSDVPMDEALVDEIEAIDDVVAAWPFRLMPATLDGTSVAVIAYDLEAYARHARRPTGGREAALEQARRSGDDAIYVSPSVISQLGYDVGATIEFPTPTGVHPIRVAGTFRDPAAITPELVFDHDTFARLWGQGGADSFGVAVTDPARVDEMADRLQAALGPRYGVEVDTNEEYMALLSSAVSSLLQLITSVQLVAVIVAGLGLANTLLISTLERRRDLGVLRAVGMLRRQLRRMVAFEALLIAGLGVGLAWGLGTLIGLGMFAVIQSQLGLSLDIVFPATGYIGAAVLGVTAAVLASLYPAERAARINVVEALQYE